MTISINGNKTDLYYRNNFHSWFDATVGPRLFVYCNIALLLLVNILNCANIPKYFHLMTVLFGNINEISTYTEFLEI